MLPRDSDAERQAFHAAASTDPGESPAGPSGPIKPIMGASRSAEVSANRARDTSSSPIVGSPRGFPEQGLRPKRQADLSPHPTMRSPIGPQDEHGQVDEATDDHDDAEQEDDKRRPGGVEAWPWYARGHERRPATRRWRERARSARSAQPAWPGRASCCTRSVLARQAGEGRAVVVGHRGERIGDLAQAVEARVQDGAGTPAPRITREMLPNTRVTVGIVST